MKKTDKLVCLLMADIENRNILEAACGTADFSLSALPFARTAACIDLDDSRLNPQARQNGLHFQVMDASRMDYADHTFDTVFIYNAFSHIYPQWKEIEKECRRVTKENGTIIIVSTWSLDTGLIRDTFGDKAVMRDDFLIVRIAV